jgi:hypothetical protein
MSIDEFLESIRRRVDLRRMEFSIRPVTAVAGNVNYWVECSTPDLMGLSVVEALGALGRRADPVWEVGLSVGDYAKVIDASHSDGLPGSEHRTLRKKLLEVCGIDVKGMHDWPHDF